MAEDKIDSGLADPKLKNTQACKEFVDLVKAVFGTGI